MTGRRDTLFNIVSIDSIYIGLLNGSEIQACCEGSIFLCSTLLLTNVLYVSNLKVI